MRSNPSGFLGWLRRRAGGLASAGDARLTRATYRPPLADGRPSPAEPRDGADARARAGDEGDPGDPAP
ncbi:hypothetical protein [Streptomyces sp.]|uniref:hypothetical protein n=1 Tax=Streptomyces sp. TaxID=1931 RepID=UPI002811F600|nr:hypothetical protein [Streptomyces sp.]